ncbi:MAG TPA: hypothetical protein VN775_06795, partial [Opitutaceae bacterium]|nr:hypothetical protein [Opitutaceae bacterium]
IGARQLGLQAFLTPYGGYLHMLPRTIAYAAGFFDPLWTPAVYNGVALCIDVAVVAMLFSQRVRLPAKPVLALALALVPHNGEVFLSLTDLQWLLALALVLLLLTDDAATAAQRWFDRGALALCGLTGPFLCFLSPLFVMRAAVRRTREAATLAVLALLAAALQANYLYAYRGHFVRAAPVDPRGLLSSMAGRLYGTFWLGYGIPNISPGLPWIATGAAVTALAGWLSLRRGDWQYPRAVLAVAWLCLVIPVAIKFRYDAQLIANPTSGDRYFFLPHVLLAWLLVVTFAQYKGWRQMIPAALLAASIGFNLPYLKAPPLHDYAWAKHVQPIRDGEEFEIPINPSGLMLEGRALNRPP